MDKLARQLQIDKIFSLTDEQAEDLLKLVDKLEQDEDIQKVFFNLA